MKVNVLYISQMVLYQEHILWTPRKIIVKIDQDIPYMFGLISNIIVKLCRIIFSVMKSHTLQIENVNIL